MITRRDWMFFIAGAFFLHTISHVILPFFISLPIKMKWLTFTAGYNIGVIILSAIATAAFLYVGAKLKK